MVQDGDGPVDFETLMKRLEAVVARLEEDDLPLEQAIEAYEAGVGLVRLGHARLEEAERRLEELTAQGTRPLDPGPEDP